MMNMKMLEALFPFIKDLSEFLVALDEHTKEYSGVAGNQQLYDRLAAFKAKWKLM